MRWEIAAPVTLYLIYRSHTHGSLTPLGIVTAAITAVLHALHPSPLPFTLLIVFFLLGTSATKVKKDVKATLTLSSPGSHVRRTSSSSAIGLFSGDWNKTKEAHEKREQAAKASAHSTAGGQEPRSAVQVLANSACVSLLCLLHVCIYGTRETAVQSKACFGSVPARDLILVGIMANYAAVTADTMSSELGILSSVKPVLIYNPFKEVAPGTNGGVTGAGLFAGLGGALVIGTVSATMLPQICDGSLEDTIGLVLAVGSWGALGSVLDSILGALLQASVVDKRSGKVVEAPNGGRVLVSSSPKKDEASSNASRILGTGRDVLDNNQVNFVMAATMTVGGIIAASQAWSVPVASVLQLS